MRHISTTAVFVCLLTLSAAAHAQGFTPEEEQLFELVNQARAEAGVAPVELDAHLGAVARSHSLDMARNQYFSHTSPTTGDLGDRLRSAEVRFQRAGENIAFDLSVEGAHEAFMNSPHHRENVLNPGYSHLGVGIVRVGERMMVTQAFTLAPGLDANPAPAPAAAPAAMPATAEPAAPAGPAVEEPATAPADEVETQPGEAAEAQRPRLLPLPELPSPFNFLQSLARVARPQAAAAAPAPEAPAPAETEAEAPAAAAETPAEGADARAAAEATEPEPVAAAPEVSEPAGEAPTAQAPEAPAENPGPGLWIVTEDGSFERVELGASALSRLLRLL